MSLREARKKMQRTIMHLANEYPAEVSRPELLKIRDTLEAALEKTAYGTVPSLPDGLQAVK